MMMLCYFDYIVINTHKEVNNYKNIIKHFKTEIVEVF